MDLKVQTNPEAGKPNPKPSVVGRYARLAASEWRLFRVRMTRQNVMAFAKRLGWTVLLTVLIWIYAEREEEVPLTSLTVPIAVKSLNSNKIATLASGENSIVCDLVGPQANLDQFRELLQPSSPIELDLDTSNMPDRSNDIPTLDLLMANSKIKSAGITVQKCTPPSLTVYVDELVQRSLPVAAPQNIAGLRIATFSPPTVSVTGPSHELQNLTHVTADIAALPILDQPGPHAPVKVPLIASSDLSYSSTEVLATLTVAEKDITYTCPNVPIWVEIVPRTAEQYSVSLVNNSGFVPQLELVGPPEQIARLRDVRPRAVLVIGPDNMSDTNPMPLEIENLPEGVRVNGPNPEVSFVATKR